MRVIVDPVDVSRLASCPAPDSLHWVRVDVDEDFVDGKHVPTRTFMARCSGCGKPVIANVETQYLWASYAVVLTEEP